MEIDDAYNVRVEVISLPQTGRVTPSLQLRYCSLPNGENLKPGEVLLENLYLTVNDAVLVKLKTLKPGDILRGPGISKVLFSRSAMLNEGDIVFGVEITWEKYLIINDDHL
jgi:NADPH-dependent curcumin reductase CurA